MNQKRKTPPQKVRTNKLNEAKSCLENRTDLCVYGERGIGKSTFLKHVADEIPQQSVIIQVRADESFESLRDRILTKVSTSLGEEGRLTEAISSNSYQASIGNLFLSWLCDIGAERSNEKKYDVDQEQHIQQLLDKNNEQIVIFLRDGYRAEPKREELLKNLEGLSSEIGPSFQIVVEQYSKRPGGKEENIELTSFNEDQTRKWIKTTYGEESTDCTKELYNKTHGDPKLLRLAAEIRIEKGDPLDYSKENPIEDVANEYIRLLDHEEREFLETLSVTSTLYSDACVSITDKSKKEVDKLLEDFTQRGIIKKEFYSEHRKPVYQIRQFLRRRLLDRSRSNQSSVEKRRRTLLQFHLEEIHQYLVSDPQEIPEMERKVSEMNNYEGRESVRIPVRRTINTFPHMIAADHYLSEIYGVEYSPDNFLNEFNRCDITYPTRFITILYIGLILFQERAPVLFKKELPNFEEGAKEFFKEEWQAAMVSDTVQQILNNLYNEQSDDSQQANNSDDIAHEDEKTLVKKEYSLSEINRLIRCISRILTIDDPREFKRHAKQIKIGTEVNNGISWDIIDDFYRYLADEFTENKDVLELSEDCSRSVQKSAFQYFRDNTNQYRLTHDMIQVTNEVINEIRTDIFADEEFLRRIANEGGDILEDADNPLFALFWYSCTSGLIEKYSDEQEQKPFEADIQELAARRYEYEEDCEMVMFKINRDFVKF